MNKIYKCLLLLTLTLNVGTLASCGGGSSTNTSSGSITIFTINGNYLEGAKKDSVWKDIEEKTNCEFTISGAINNGDYYTTLSPKLNSAKNIPDVFFSVPNGTDSSYYTWANQSTGILYNLDELLAGKEEQYPYLTSIINSQQYRNMRFDGAHTIIPLPSKKSGWGIYYRSDWLINVGYYQKDSNGQPILDENGKKIARTPVTMDEFTEVLKLFTENDPDGNGKKDTYGMSPGAEHHITNPLYHAFGVPTDWDINDENEVEYMYLTPEYKNYLNWFREQYNAGYIDPQFYMNKNGADRSVFEKGKSGIIITNAEDHVLYVAKPMEDIFGKGKTIMGAAPIGTKTCGKEGCQGFSDWGGLWGGFSITKACKDVDAALRLFEYLRSPEGQLEGSYGIKDVHYKLNEQGKAEAILENRYKEPEETFNAIKDETSSLEPAGTYRFYDVLLSYPSVWNLEDESYVINTNNKCIDTYYYKLMDDADDLMVTYTTKLLNFTDLTSSVLKKRSQVEEEVNSYVVQAMACKKNIDSDYDKMIENCEGYGLDTIKRIILSKAQELGIVK